MNPILIQSPKLISPKTFSFPIKYQLPNGLTVILDENHAAPVVSLNIGVKIGSAWETPSELGLSHVLEHMVFKGTTSYGPGEIASIVEGCGGELNAYTSLDQTVYYINLAAHTRFKGLNLIKEMVFDALIDSTELEREKEVVIEEIRRGKDSPQRVISEAVFEEAYKIHPYGRPIIGSVENVKGFPRAQVYEFYKRWYVPNNMVLVICGDFLEAEMREAIEKEFGDYASKPVKYPPLPAEPARSKPQFRQLSKNIEGTYLSIAFPAPNFSHPDVPALDLFSHLLGEGQASRLEQIIKEQKGLVNSISSYAFTPREPGLFMVQAHVPADQNINKVFEAILEEINTLKKNLVSLDTLNRSKLNIRSSVYYQKETCEGTARKWITYETTTGDLTFEEKYLAAIEQTTPEEITKVAKTYLNVEYLSAVLLHPEKSKTKLKPNLGVRQKNLSHQKNYEKVAELNDIQLWKLREGITVITRPNLRLPLLSLYMASPGGLRYETSANTGISQLMASLLSKGTESKSSLQIAKINESIAGHVDAYAGRNTWGVSASFLTEKFEAGLDLFCDVLTHPLFDSKELKKEQKLQLESIKNQEDSLGSLAFQKFQHLLYKKHPYGRPLLGTKKTVSSFNREALVRFHQKLLDPARTVITAVGNFNTETLLTELQERLALIKSEKKKPFRLPAEKKSKTIQKIEYKKKKEQAHIVLGFLGTTVNHPDRYPLEVLNNIFSGQGGRLFLELRDKQSLAYTVTSTMMEGLEPGYFAIYIGTEPSKVDLAISGILSELVKIREALVSEDEVTRAKNYIVGNYAIDLQRNSAVASTLTLNELHGLGLKEFENYSKKISAVTPSQVLSVARRYLDLQAYTLAVIRP